MGRVGPLQITQICVTEFVNERPKHGKQLNVGSDLRLDLGLDVKDLRSDLRLALNDLQLDLRLDLRLAPKDLRLA